MTHVRSRAKPHVLQVRRRCSDSVFTTQTSTPIDSVSATPNSMLPDRPRLCYSELDLVSTLLRSTQSLLYSDRPSLCSTPIDSASLYYAESNCTRLTVPATPNSTPSNQLGLYHSELDCEWPLRQVAVLHQTFRCRRYRML